jgi:tRNA1(Val) A37 N6-methylase TrmN6
MSCVSFNPVTPPLSANAATHLEQRRIQLASVTPALHKAAFGQFLTPAPIAERLSALFSPFPGKAVCLLDAGAGIGSLTAAALQRALLEGASTVETHTWEVDPLMLPHLQETLNHLKHESQQVGIPFSAQIHPHDYLQAATNASPPRYTHTILNPPYKKIGATSEARRAVQALGIETVNMYAAFVAVALQQLVPGGELVAITPRSFCNGPYFKPFRKFLLSQGALTHVHVFATRDKVFQGDLVLQETILFKIVKGARQGTLCLSSSTDGSFKDEVVRQVPFEQVVLQEDPEVLIHLPIEAETTPFATRAAHFPHTLEALGLGVATGPVVDFRLKAHLLLDPTPTSLPLIYPLHFEQGFVVWPKPDAKKPNAIEDHPDTSKWLMPSGHYTLVRRLSSKEEKRRIVAAVFDPTGIPGSRIGFENHLNVFHQNKAGLPPLLAKGLAVYLSSTLVDAWLRRFSGHTQVNAGDLRALRYPSLKTLSAWGGHVGSVFPSQLEIDALIEGSS